jgi:hypothetical protein
MKHLSKKLRSRVLRVAIFLGGGGPLVLILADRIAHSFGICLGF